MTRVKQKSSKLNSKPKSSKKPQRCLPSPKLSKPLKRRRPSSTKGRDDTHFTNLFDNHVNFKERVIYLNDEIDECSLDLVQKALDEMERDRELAIRIEISSYGGSVYDMFGIIDRIQTSPCTILTRGFGKIMSAATLILAAGHDRWAGENAWFMIHEPSYGDHGNHSYMQNEVAHSQQLREKMLELYAKLSRNGTDISVFRKLFKKNSYMTSEQAKALGLVDRIL